MLATVEFIGNSVTAGLERQNFGRNCRVVLEDEETVSCWSRPVSGSDSDARQPSKALKLPGYLPSGGITSLPAEE
jgi:hypothetical protein